MYRSKDGRDIATGDNQVYYYAGHSNQQIEHTKPTPGVTKKEEIYDNEEEGIYEYI